jgi:hypothetical protein
MQQPTFHYNILNTLNIKKKSKFPSQGKSKTQGRGKLSLMNVKPEAAMARCGSTIFDFLS